MSSANEAGEEDGVGGRTEDITVDLLPAILIPQISLLRWVDTVIDTQTDRHTDIQAHTRSSSSMLTRPTRNITIMKELNIENQWIWRQDAGVQTVGGRTWYMWGMCLAQVH